MWKKIKNFWHQDEYKNLHVPKNIKMMFKFKYKDLEIGCLSLNNGKWTFIYSEEFKNQNEIPALIDFPILSKEYQSENLWPIFAIRIPSLNQPKVRKIIWENNIDSNNEAELLKKFGKHSISNPFELKEELSCN